MRRLNGRGAAWRSIRICVIPIACLRLRSEERRVGRECRSRCDWSSDVCSSDLFGLTSTQRYDEAVEWARRGVEVNPNLRYPYRVLAAEIGRASCRERV